MTYTRHSWSLSSWGSSACHTYRDTGHPFYINYRWPVTLLTWLFLIFRTTDVISGCLSERKIEDVAWSLKLRSMLIAVIILAEISALWMTIYQEVWTEELLHILTRRKCKRQKENIYSVKQSKFLAWWLTFAATCINYVNIQHSYLNMRLIYVTCVIIKLTIGLIISQVYIFILHIGGRSMHSYFCSTKMIYYKQNIINLQQKHLVL